jgi:hypothetical protein
MLLLHCYLLGDEPDQISSVKIEEIETVGILIKLIKEENTSLKDVDAKFLKIWKVDLPISNLLNNLENITLADNNSLSATQQLSRIFSISTHDPERVHIVIKSPSVKPG